MAWLTNLFGICFVAGNAIFQISSGFEHVPAAIIGNIVDPSGGMVVRQDIVFLVASDAELLFGMTNRAIFLA